MFSRCKTNTKAIILANERKQFIEDIEPNKTQSKFRLVLDLLLIG